TTRSGRFCAWLGAIPHWLYPSVLRSQPELWSQVVVWTSVLGVFLTALGLFIGFRVLLQSRVSHYEVLMLQHHICGLLFGVVALAWVLSGLFCVNPWGLMEGGDVTAARDRLLGSRLGGEEIQAFLHSMVSFAPSGTKSIESAPLNGRLFAVGIRDDRTR